MKRRIQRKINLFKKIASRLQKMKNRGDFELLPKHKLVKLSKRFNRITQQLKKYLSVHRFKKLVTSVGIASCLVISNTANAQSFLPPQSPMFGKHLGPPVFGEPNPVFVDIDNDGDLDLFAGGQSSVIAFMENKGTHFVPDFAPKIRSPFGIDLMSGTYHAQLTFGDLDNDGDLDLIIGLEGDGASLQYYKNIGTNTAPKFSLVSTSIGLRNFNVEAPAPDLVDLDDDGDLDLLVGGDGNNLDYFENVGTISKPSFAVVQANPFGLDAVNSYHHVVPRLSDIDSDGDLDIYMRTTDLNNNHHIAFVENVGTATSPSFIAPTQPAALNVNLEEYGGLAIGDIDTDGDLDIFITTDAYYENYFDIGAYYFENIGTAFTPTFNPPILNPFGVFFNGFASPQLTTADIDNDGDQDIFIGGGNQYSGKIGYLENIGTSTNPILGNLKIIPFNNNLFTYVSVPSPALVDIDGDDDFDLFFTGNGFMFYAENIGTINNPNFTDLEVNPFNISGFNPLTKPNFVDMDDDNDFDLVIGMNNGSVGYFENIGTATIPVFSDLTTIISDAIGVFPVVGDLDNDGDFDILMDGDNGLGRFAYYENTGTVTTSNFTDYELNPFNLIDIITITNLNTRVYPTFVDIDNDNDLDIIATNNFGDTFFFEQSIVNIEPQKNLVDVELALYPNPTSDFIQLKIKGLYGQSPRIEIMSNIGNVIHKEKIASISNDFEQRFKVTNFSSGLYIMRIIMDDGSSVSKLFIKE